MILTFRIQGSLSKALPSENVLEQKLLEQSKCNDIGIGRYKAKRGLFSLNQPTVKYWNLYCFQYMFNT